MREFVDFCHYFVICTATSSVHTRALSDHLKQKIPACHPAGRKAWHIEGSDFGHWILMDYIDVIVHIFLEEEREYYDLESLWGDVPKEKI